MKDEQVSEAPEPIESQVEASQEQEAEPIVQPETEDQAESTPENSQEGVAPETPVTLTAGEVLALQEAAQKAQEHWDRYLRLNAEFDNFKKRASRERLDAIKYANEALLERLIPTLDHFEMALAAIQGGQEQSMESLKMGIDMVHGQLKNVLKDAGLEEIDARGMMFDPTWHEAIATEPSDEMAEGHVLEQRRKGYKLSGRLIRPATVVIVQKPSNETEAPAASED